MRSCNRYEEEIYAKERKSISIVKREKREGMRIYQRTVKKGVY